MYFNNVYINTIIEYKRKQKQIVQFASYQFGNTFFSDICSCLYTSFSSLVFYKLVQLFIYNFHVILYIGHLNLYMYFLSMI